MDMLVAMSFHFPLDGGALAYIPPTFKIPHTEELDTNYMRQLFDLAYELATNGYPWEKTPPGLKGPEIPIHELYEINQGQVWNAFDPL